ncbi:Hypothetical predicted protein [Marmota monax]|uniref:Uncharacterized protein n=1 Tax=Marmota monax TaxID=9995 RepID=A0A5E4A5K7_MARMO|nr:hypothetical protein GHT09_003147 [Marmota monax]VTJ52196.1 Hypothetical predicted protein [Marmota monax]
MSFRENEKVHQVISTIPSMCKHSRRQNRLRCHVSEQSKTPGKEELKTLYRHQI